MAREYIVLTDNEDGLIALSKHVLESITRYSIEEEKNVSIEPNNAFHSSIQCKVIDNKLAIDAEINVKYGENVTKICELLQEKITNVIYQTCEIRCNKVDINVIGFNI